MEKEQNLVKLIKVAFANGWNQSNRMCIYDESGHFFDSVGEDSYIEPISIILNDVEINFFVTDVQFGKISFIDALVAASVNMDRTTDDGTITMRTANHYGTLWCWLWNTKTGTARLTSERLDWLFETFNHLL
jgi:hypothetical protein